MTNTSSLAWRKHAPGGVWTGARLATRKEARAMGDGQDVEEPYDHEEGDGDHDDDEAKSASFTANPTAFSHPLHQPTTTHSRLPTCSSPTRHQHHRQPCATPVRNLEFSVF